MTQEHKELYRLFRIGRTCLQMLNDRGYSILDGNSETSFENFQAKIKGDLRKDELTIIASNPENSQDLIVVFFIEADGKNKISKKLILNYYERVKKQEISRSILVTPFKLSTQAEILLQSLQNGSNGSIIIETFQESEL